MRKRSVFHLLFTAQVPPRPGLARQEPGAGTPLGSLKHLNRQLLPPRAHISGEVEDTLGWRMPCPKCHLNPLLHSTCTGAPSHFSQACSCVTLKLSQFTSHSVVPRQPDGRQFYKVACSFSHLSPVRNLICLKLPPGGGTSGHGQPLSGAPTSCSGSSRSFSLPGLHQSQLPAWVSWPPGMMGPHRTCQEATPRHL